MRHAFIVLFVVLAWTLLGSALALLTSISPAY